MVANYMLNEEIIDDAFEYTLRMPQNEQEAFATFCALNVIRAGMKEGVVSKEKGYGITKSYVSKLATFIVEHPELKLVDKIYFDNSIKPNCAFFVCMGVQFSFHSVAVNDTLTAFSASPQNQLIEFDGIRKQPIAEEMFNLAKEILAKKISDKERIANQVRSLAQNSP